MQDIITDGSGTFNLRRYCTLGQVCCTYPQPVTTAAPTTASPSSSTLPPYTYTDCGVPSPDAIKCVTALSLALHSLTHYHYIRSAPINIKITATATGSQVTSYGEFPWMAAILGTVAWCIIGLSDHNLCRQGHRGLHLWRQPGVGAGGADGRPLRPGPRPRLPHGQAGRVGRQRHH